MGVALKCVNPDFNCSSFFSASLLLQAAKFRTIIEKSNTLIILFILFSRLKSRCLIIFWVWHGRGFEVNGRRFFMRLILAILRRHVRA